MSDDLLGFLDFEGEPEIFFSAFPIDQPTKEYTIIIKDLSSIRPLEEGRNKHTYIVVRATPVLGFADNDFCLCMDAVYRFHFPLKAFTQAWLIGPSPTRLSSFKNKLVDCRITFVRKNREKIRILKREYLEVDK